MSPDAARQAARDRVAKLQRLGRDVRPGGGRSEIRFGEGPEIRIRAHIGGASHRGSGRPLASPILANPFFVLLCCGCVFGVCCVLCCCFVVCGDVCSRPFSTGPSAGPSAGPPPPDRLRRTALRRPSLRRTGFHRTGLRRIAQNIALE